LLLGHLSHFSTLFALACCVRELRASRHKEGESDTPEPLERFSWNDVVHLAEASGLIGYTTGK
jgi:hypothetical protein